MGAIAGGRTPAGEGNPDLSDLPISRRLGGGGGVTDSGGKTQNEKRKVLFPHWPILVLHVC